MIQASLISSKPPLSCLNVDVAAASSSTAVSRPVRVWFVVQFRLLCQICLVLPLAGLVACLIVAVIFQFGDIQETACKVRNDSQTHPVEKIVHKTENIKSE
jgi:hypothetical protein